MARTCESATAVRVRLRAQPNCFIQEGLGRARTLLPKPTIVDCHPHLDAHLGSVVALTIHASGDEPRDPPPNSGRSDAIDVMTPEDALGIGIGDDILAVDDSPANLIAAEAALAPLGRKLVTATSGLEALAKLLEQDFALILLDVSMPGMSGIETARLIRSRERSGSTPIIFVTGMAWQDAAIDEAYEVGGYDFLMKPVRPEMLRAKARVFLQLQERTRALQRKAAELRESQARLHEHELREERKRLKAEALEEQLQQLARMDRERHEFVAILGHELRNPIHTLQIAVDAVLQHSTADPERVASLVERRFNHVTRIVDDLLDITRITTGQVELCNENIDLGEIVRQAIEDCQSILELRKHELVVEIREAAPVVQGDAVRLLQAFTSLIDNAARYTPNRGRVHVTLEVDAGDVVVCITDTGSGINPELLPRIFDMFVRDRAGVDGSGGLGLGLALVKRLIELHEGSVSAASEGPDKGSTFEVRIPLAPQDVVLMTLDMTDPGILR